MRRLETWTIHGHRVAGSTMSASILEAGSTDTRHDEADGSAERLEAAEVLRISSQKLSAAASYHHAGFAPSDSLVRLKDARRGFTQSLDVLCRQQTAADGGSRKADVIHLEAIRSEFATMTSAIDALAADHTSTEAYDLIDARDTR